MTSLQRQCLEYYAQPWPRPVIIQSREAWNNKHLNWALDRSLVAVGSHGAHEITDAGRAALAGQG